MIPMPKVAKGGGKITIELLHQQMLNRATLDVVHLKHIVDYWGYDLINTLLMKGEAVIRIIEAPKEETPSDA